MVATTAFGPSRRAVPAMTCTPLLARFCAMSADCARASSRTRRFTSPRLTLIACWTCPPPVVRPSSLADCIEVMTSMQSASELGLTTGGGQVQHAINVNLGLVNRRVLELARAQSADIAQNLASSGVQVIAGTARLEGPNAVVATIEGGQQRFDAEVILLATGTRPRELPDAKPDGERILNWKQVYSLEQVPEHLVVVGSGVTGAEFASAYSALANSAPVTPDPTTTRCSGTCSREYTCFQLRIRSPSGFASGSSRGRVPVANRITSASNRC